MVKQLLYLPRSVRPKRLSAHFSTSTIEDELWKTQIDKTNIVTFRLNTKTDLDIYETYFINKLKPLYNEEKVFYDLPTFDLPELTPKIYVFSSRSNTKRLTPEFLEYIELRESGQDVDKYKLEFPKFVEEYPLVLENKKVLELMNKVPESIRLIMVNRLSLSGSYVKFDKSSNRFIWK